jgi:anti-sigma-K factor RskA
MAAYVLGILDASDHAAFEEHLQGCPHCQLDLLELHDLPDLLAKVKRRWPRPPVPSSADSQEMRPVAAPVRAAPETGQPLATLLDEAASSRRKQRWRSRILVTAAAFLIVAGPLVTLAVTSGQQTPDAPLAAASTSVPEVHTGSAASPNDGIKAHSEIAHLDTIDAKVSVTAQDWGTQADLELGGITGPLKCQLFAVTYGGDSQVMTSWSVPVKGFGVPDSPEPLRVSGGTALAPSEIERFEVRTEDGSLLVTVDH